MWLNIDPTGDRVKRGLDRATLVEVALAADGARVDWRFCPLPARPLVRQTLSVDAVGEADLEVYLRSLIAEAPVDAVLTIRVEGTITDGAARFLSAAHLRSLAPATINVELRPTE